jgi:hypothetical protein
MQPGDGSESGTTRRGFGQALAAGATLALVPPMSGARADAPAITADEVLLALVRSRYGEFLTRDQTAAVHRSLRRGVARGQTLARVRLTNADEPAMEFRADVP